MKTLLLVAGSRAGSDFFQSLLDGHSQILQFPGTLQTSKKLSKILSLENPNDISTYFIKKYLHFLQSRKSIAAVSCREACGRRGAARDDPSGPTHALLIIFLAKNTSG